MKVSKAKCSGSHIGHDGRSAVAIEHFDPVTDRGFVEPSQRPRTMMAYLGNGGTRTRLGNNGTNCFYSPKHIHTERGI